MEATSTPTQEAEATVAAETDEIEPTSKILSAAANKEIDSLKATINELTAFIYLLTTQMENDAFDDLVRSINRHAMARAIKQRLAEARNK